MSVASKIKRRGFVKLCASAIATVGANPELLAEQGGEVKFYNRVKLVDSDGKPMSPNRLEIGETYVFDYPYITTPCFLLNLGRPTATGVTLETEDGASYRWQGGCGPQRSIVAFSAICAHKMSHPAKAVSFINYRHNTVSFRDHDEKIVKRDQVIYCCSEKSVYDPANGAQVLGGPAPQPLAAIFLEHHESDGALYAGGTCGGEMYQKFFDTYAFRLALEHQTSDIQRQVTERAEVVTVAEYSSMQIMC